MSTATRADQQAAANAADSHDLIRVHGARENNLKDISVELPKRRLTVFTGVSGSGKSSLAFGTIYAEAQRRYFESVTPYARRLLDQQDAPKVRDITGLPSGVTVTGDDSGALTISGAAAAVNTLLQGLTYTPTGEYEGSDTLNLSVTSTDRQQFKRTALSSRPASPAAPSTRS